MKNHYQKQRITRNLPIGGFREPIKYLLPDEVEHHNSRMARERKEQLDLKRYLLIELPICMAIGLAFGILFGLNF